MKLPADPRIATERLLLRLVRESDLPDLLLANGDDDVTRHLPYPSWQGMDDATAWLGRSDARLANDEALQFVLELRRNGRVIGSLLLFHFEPGQASGEIGYLLAREFWGHGYMAEAAQALIAFARQSLGLRSLKAIIEPANTASARLLEKLGFEPQPDEATDDVAVYRKALA